MAAIGTAWVDGAWIFESWAVGAWSTAASATITGSATETQLVTGGQVFTVTLTADTLLAAGTGPIGSIANTQALIDGLVSAQSEANGWNAERPNIAVTDVVRTSDTIATLTLPALTSYAITADEILTWTIPAEVLTAATELVGSPTIAVTAEAVARAGGRVRRPKRYVVEVDGELFVAGTIAEAESILQRVRDLADESADRDVKTEITPKPPRVRIKTGAGKPTTSVVLQREVKKTQKVVNQAYSRRAKEISQDIEISRLMLGKIAQEEQEDEDAIIALLLM